MSPEQEELIWEEAESTARPVRYIAGTLGGEPAIFVRQVTQDDWDMAEWLLTEAQAGCLQALKRAAHWQANWFDMEERIGMYQWLLAEARWWAEGFAAPTTVVTKQKLEAAFDAAITGTFRLPWEDPDDE